MNLGDPNIPIVGQAAATIPAQIRVDAVEAVGRQLEQCKRLGLRFGRFGVPCQIHAASAVFLLVLEAFEAAGARIIAVTEHPISQDALMCFITFRCPESLFQPKPLI